MTVEARKRLLHQPLPRVVIAGWGRLPQYDVIAHGLSRHQGQPPCKRFILRQCDGFGGHVLGQTRAFLSAIRHDRLLYLMVDLLVRPIIGSRVHYVILRRRPLEDSTVVGWHEKIVDQPTCGGIRHGRGSHYLL
jgi:hypothetical protein